MTHSQAYADLVADFGRRFIAASCEQERFAVRADFDAELALLNTLGPRDRSDARDPVAERMLAARFGMRAH